MKRFYLFLLIAYASLSYTYANTKEASNANEPVTKTIIIRFKDQFNASGFSENNLTGYKASAKRNMFISKMKSYNFQLQEKLLNTFQGLKNIRQFWIANIISAEATDEMIEQLKKREDIEDVTIDDKQATYDNEEVKTSESLAAGTIAYNVEMVRAPEANKYGYTGSGVIVGIVDSGVNSEHTDLKNSLWEDPGYPNHGWNSALNNNETEDVSGHGTHCAGTIVGNGASGMRTGIAPDAKLMIVRPWDNNGYSNQTYTLSAIQFAAEHGANLISMSMGFSKLSNADKKNWRDAMNNLLNCNILMVTAAGNEGKIEVGYPIPDNVRIPGACPAPWINPGQTLKGGISGVLTVGNLYKTGDKRYDSSSKGPVTWQGVESFNDYPYKPEMGLIKPDISVPGQDIPSLDWENPTGYKEQTGTSMATPCVAGIAALILSKNPEMTPTDITRIISESAIKISPEFNNETGAGRADALLATLYTPNPDMNCATITIKETVGSMNGYLNKGDEANLSFSFKNESNEDISDYELEINCLYPHAVFTIKDNKLPIIKAGETTELTDYCSIKILPEAQFNELIDITVIVKKGDKVWTNLLRLPVCKAELSDGDMEVKEIEGNNNSLIEAGEKAELIFHIFSTGSEPCRDVNALLTSDSPYITFSEALNFKEISSSEDIRFECNISGQTPKWYTTSLSLKLKGENVDTTFSYRLIIGKQAILIVDRSKGGQSANSVDSYLAKTNYSYAKVKSLPTSVDSLRLYHSIWFFSGVYPKSNALKETEIQTLTDYIKAGGFLYMEGGDLWMKNKSELNDYMNINPIDHDGGKLNFITGCMTGFNTDYKEKYTYANSSIDKIEPIAPAFVLYKNDDPEFITTVAYNQGTYRTIGSSIEAGGVTTSTGENKLIESFLDFFLIKEGYFTTGINNVEQTNRLNVNCFKSGNDYILDISLPGSSAATINIYSMDGQLLKQMHRNIVENCTLVIPNNNYKGIKYVTVGTAEETVTKKIVF